MLASLWISKTGLSAQDTALSTISNNLANISTTGFKKDRPEFEDLLYQIKRQPGGLSTQNTRLPSGLQIGTGVRVLATQKIFSQGDSINTGNTFDMMIQGEGFFRVQLPDGTLGYTRKGAFELNDAGDLVTPEGYLLDPQINVQGATQVSIDANGNVEAILNEDSANPQIVGTIQLSRFVNPAGLQAVGGTLFKETAASGAPAEGQPGLDGMGRTIQGMLEASNVSAVEELVNMITTQRAYEMNSKVISTADQMLGFVTQQL
ncbi:flagellar basal-body rod protein FlgG [Balneatrix alpica]|uniref:Flagellar basal-body rod protein FlgG n=1 Tax=Balneatrix alpica TaxID=75684 RepID=A0ABV5ZEE6_9GAMM|nr:flagellar basal-body rod protein FlgG [Balneatrix alpica]